MSSNLKSIALVFVLFSASTAQADKELQALRAELESTRHALKIKRAENEIRRMAQSQNIAQLEAELLAAEVESQTLQSLRSKLDAQAKNLDGKKSDELHTIENILKILNTHINEGLPFRQEERRLALERIKKSGERGGLTQAVLPLESFLRAEAKLHQDIIRGDSVIEVENKNYRAEVVVFAMQSLVFELQNGDVGLAYLNAAGGVETRLSEGAEADEVRAWFGESSRGNIPMGDIR